MLCSRNAALQQPVSWILILPTLLVLQCYVHAEFASQGRAFVRRSTPSERREHIHSITRTITTNNPARPRISLDTSATSSPRLPMIKHYPHPNPYIPPEITVPSTPLTPHPIPHLSAPTQAASASPPIFSGCTGSAAATAAAFHAYTSTKKLANVKKLTQQSASNLIISHKSTVGKTLTKPKTQTPHSSTSNYKTRQTAHSTHIDSDCSPGPRTRRP